VKRVVAPKRGHTPKADVRSAFSFSAVFEICFRRAEAEARDGSTLSGFRYLKERDEYLLKPSFSEILPPYNSSIGNR
jgi:hypothetical protein